MLSRAISGHSSDLHIQVLPHHCLKGGQERHVTMETRGTASYRLWMRGCFDQMVAVARGWAQATAAYALDSSLAVLM